MSLQEWIEIVSLYYTNDNCARAAARVFNETHHKSQATLQATHKYIIDLIHKFSLSWSEYNKKYNRQGLASNQTIEVTVLRQISLEDQQPVSQY